jgi:hypothetical protein
MAWTETLVAPSSSAETGGTTTSSWVVLNAVETSQQRTVGGQLLAGHRTGTGDEGAERGELRAVVRRPQGDQPAHRRSAVPLLHPEPGHDAAGGVADHVDRGGTGAGAHPGRRRGERLGLVLQVAEGAVGELDHRDVPAR